MRTFSVEEIEGEFEALMIEEEKIRSMQLTIKANKKDISDRIKDFAKDLETKPKEVKRAYDYYKSLQEAKPGESSTGDGYTIMAMLDAARDSEQTDN